MYLRYMCAALCGMAEYHLHARFISRGKGQSAVVGASYIHSKAMHFEREGRTVDLSRFNSEFLAHSEMLIPNETPQWFRNLIDGRDHAAASEALWNFVENERKHGSAQLCKEIEFSFPLETSREQNIEMAREFLARFTERGMVVDWAYHHKDGNPHAHAYLTIQPMLENGFGSTQIPKLDKNGNQIRVTRKDNGKSQLINTPWAGEYKKELLFEREAWAKVANKHLEMAGLDARIDHRSHADRGLVLEPGVHVGPGANAMAERGIDTERGAKHEETRDANRSALRKNPGLILSEMTSRQSVFTRSDIAVELNKYFDDQAEFVDLMARIDASPELVPLRVKGGFSDGKAKEATHFTTREMLRIETRMMTHAGLMAASNGFAVHEKHIGLALGRYNYLSDEQQAAVRHITGESQIACVIGAAGSGKSTLLKAAREAWEAQGYEVFGAALAGKAAEELEHSSGIRSRTLASLELSLANGRTEFGPNHVYVIDEAGMVGSKQLAHFIEQAHEAGAKVVLAGDPKQLQPINAGAAMKAVAEKVGYAEVQTIRRQKVAWQREASMALSRGDVGTALDAYQNQGHLHEQGLKTAAVLSMAKSISADVLAGRDVMGLAHTNKDVGAVNRAVRAQLQERGYIKESVPFPAAKGLREFGPGDRLVFLQNDRDLGVKNGTLAKVTQASSGALVVEADDGRSIDIQAKTYNSVDHAYALTVHKSQGATVDRVHVLATRSMTKNLAYVAMTRHREQLDVHYSRKSFDIYPGGMAQSMSRADTKPVTVDYETTIEFGQRRGHDTAKAILNRARQILKSGSEQIDMARLKDQLNGWVDRQSEKVRVFAAGQQPKEAVSPARKTSQKAAKTPSPQEASRGKSNDMSGPSSSQDPRARIAALEKEIAAQKNKLTTMNRSRVAGAHYKAEQASARMLYQAHKAQLDAKQRERRALEAKLKQSERLRAKPESQDQLARRLGDVEKAKDVIKAREAEKADGLKKARVDSLRADPKNAPAHVKAAKAAKAEKKVEAAKKTPAPSKTVTPQKSEALTKERVEKTGQNLRKTTPKAQTPKTPTQQKTKGKNPSIGAIAAEVTLGDMTKPKFIKNPHDPKTQSKPPAPKGQKPQTGSSLLGELLAIPSRHILPDVAARFSKGKPDDVAKRAKRQAAQTKPTKPKKPTV